MLKVQRLLSRVKKNHVAADHRLRLQRVNFKSDCLELFCVFCGVALVSGSPGEMNSLAECLTDGGVSVYKLNIANSSIRVH